MPTYTIASNAGVEGAVVVGKLLEQNNLDIGYDAAKGTPRERLVRSIPVALVSLGSPNLLACRRICGYDQSGNC